MTVFYPASTVHYSWLVVISLAIFYNLIMLIGRIVFIQLTEYYHLVWIVMDYLCDFVYLLDMLVRFRTGEITSDITLL